MKKKLLIVLLTITTALCCAFGFSACGADGKSAYDLAVENGFEGTVTEWLESLKGADGVDGKDGTNGTNGTNGTDGINGTNGTDGSKGSDGKSAYDLAVENGFKGTLTEWLESLNGTDGENGTDGSKGSDGKSAYDLAVENGFEGTLTEWLESLNGTDGENGKDGINGSDGLSVVCVAVVNNEWVVYFSDGTSQIVPELYVVSDVVDITTGSYTAEKVTQYGGKYYKLVVPEGETYSIEYDGNSGYIYLGQTEYSSITKGDIFVNGESLNKDWDFNSLTAGTYYLRVVAAGDTSDVNFKVSTKRELTAEQLYDVYKNVSRAIYGGDESAVYNSRAKLRSATNTRSAVQHIYDIHALDVFNDWMIETDSVDNLAAEYLYYDDELQIYFRLPEYCLAQEGFEVGVWHNSDTSEIYYDNMLVKIWYDNDNIYFSYVIRPLDIFSYSVMDYDFETGNFYCKIFAGKVDNIYNNELSDVEFHRYYEIAYENGKFSGYFDGSVFDSVSGKINRYILVEDFDNITEEEQAKLDALNALKERYLKDVYLTDRQFADITSGLDKEVEDVFAANYFVALDCLNQNTDYAGRAASLISLIEEFPVDCNYLTYAKGYLNDLQFIVDNCSDKDSWLHYNGIALFEAIEEELREPYLIKVKEVSDFDEEERMHDYPVYYIFTEYDLETQTFPRFYTDEACEQPLTFDDFAALKLDGTDALIYLKW